MATRKCGNIYFSEILYGRQAVFYEDFFSRTIWVGGVPKFPLKFRQVHNLKISNRLLRSKSFFPKKYSWFYMQRMCTLSV